MDILINLKEKDMTSSVKELYFYMFDQAKYNKKMVMISILNCNFIPLLKYKTKMHLLKMIANCLLLVSNPIILDSNMNILTFIL